MYTILHIKPAFYLEGLSETRQRSESTLASRQSLNQETQACNHRQATVLDLGLLELESAFGLGCEAQGVEGTTGVNSLFGVSRSVTEEFNASHQDGVGNGKLVDVKGEIEVGVLRLAVLKADGILPRDAGGCFGGENSESTQHSPAAMNELALTEPGEAEDFAVRLEGVGADLINNGGERAEDTSGLVDGGVLVELIDINLEVFDGLGEAEGIESTVTREGAVEPVGAGGVGEPEGFACKDFCDCVNCRRFG